MFINIVHKMIHAGRRLAFEFHTAQLFFVCQSGLSSGRCSQGRTNINGHLVKPRYVDKNHTLEETF